MNNNLEQSLFDLHCKVESISSLVRNALVNLENGWPSDATQVFREQYGDAYNLALLASKQIADVDQMLLVLTDAVIEMDFHKTVQVDVAASVTVSANAVGNHRGSREREVTVCTR